MTTEEKAKRYDEALKVLHKYDGAHIMLTQDLKEEMFPELKESEDKQSKEWILEYLYDGMRKSDEQFKGQFKAAIEWLEKQGEKPVELSKEEYRKAYYDGWNNCNLQHSQRLSDSNDVVKCLINGMKFYYEGNEEATWGTENFSMKVKDIIAWLEKQGEQNPFDYEHANIQQKDFAPKVEPKFKVGDWIINKFRDICLITDIDLENGYYICESNRFGNTNGDINLTDEMYHLWTIEDAKDGDVLEFGDHGRLVVGIVSYVNKTTGKVDVNCLLENNNFKMGNYYNLDTIKPHPSTKEQRDLLFQKLQEAGYKWNAEKKELKEIEQSPYPKTLDKAIELYYYSYGNGKGGFNNLSFENFKDIVKTFVEDYGNKPTWSEEDEKNLKKAVWYVENPALHVVKDMMLSEWLKSLKDRCAWKL